MPKILTIEDDETTAQEIVAELSHHGFEVDWASNGEEGVKQSIRFDYAGSYVAAGGRVDHSDDLARAAN